MDRENDSESDSSESDAANLYRCRLCGLDFEADQRDGHRQTHENHNQEPRGNVAGNVEVHENALDEDSNEDMTGFFGDCGELSHSFECGICPQTFNDENEAEDHRQNHTSNEANSNQSDEQERSGERQGQNSPDNADNNDFSDSDSDESSSDTDSDELILYKCAICGRIFEEDERDERDEHRAVHQNQ